MRADRFTVNLGVFHDRYREDAASPKPIRPLEYHCLIRERLAGLRSTPFTAFFKRIVSDRDGLLGWWLTTPSDRWWRFSDNAGEVHAELTRLLPLLLSRGLDWLDENGTVEALHQVFERLKHD